MIHRRPVLPCLAVLRRVPPILAAALVGLVALASSARAIVPPNPERGEEARRAFTELASKLAANAPGPARGAEVSFRPLAPEETRHLRALVVLVDFSDQPATRSASEMNDLLFSSHALSSGSLRDFYEENSNGRLDVTGTVIGWVRAPQTYAYYVDNQFGFGTYPRSAQRLAEDAVALARARVDFAQFDNDGPDGIPSSGDDDGFVDALVVIHSGIGAEDAAQPTKHIWSHSSSLSHQVPGTGVSGYFFSMTPEISQVGVQCHEFGHTLGLPDLYDTTPPGAPDSYGLGIWSLMAVGAWGGPSGLKGSRPSHLDAWCKARLGFVNPVDLTHNVPSAVFAPVESGGAVYRLWTNGDEGPEYFLAENRFASPQNFDQYLPASGLLIYHVDELALNNDDASRYRVALVQADGLRDLENNRNDGNAGDPFPSGGGQHSFTDGTTPSARSNGGAPTQVAVTSINDSDPETITAALAVENEPAFRVVSMRAEAPDGWPWPDWGVESPFTITVVNAGTTAGSTTASLELDDARVHVSAEGVPIGALGEDSEAPAAFTLAVDPIAADTTIGVPGRVLFAHDGVTDTAAVLVTIGRKFGLATGFENGIERAGWTHAPVFPGKFDSWGTTSKRVHGGATAYRFTDPSRETYQIDSDGALVSPPVLLGVNSRLSFWHWISAETESGPYAFDGARVEMSLDGGPWEPIEPEGGYPFRMDPITSTMLERQHVYSGDAGWRPATFDLPAAIGSARFRFRFVSDEAVNREGWYIDDVRVTTQASRFSVVFDSLGVEEGGIRITWTVDPVLGPYDGSGFRLYRSTASAPGNDPSRGYELIAEIAADSAGVFMHFDPVTARGVTYSYLLEELDAAGAVRSVFGPVSVFLTPSDGDAALAPPSPNPFRPGRGAITLSYVIPRRARGGAGGIARVSIYDLQGRRVRVLDERPAAEGRVVLTWDGRDGSGRDLPSGLYVARLDVPGAHSNRRLVLIR